jgi:MFS family permease
MRVREPSVSGGPPHPSRQSLRGLDWFIFFVADVQTGFGPFLAVYLTSQKWTQVDIGLVLTVGGLVSVLGQTPGGAAVDAARSERLVAGLALAAISGSALAYATSPIFPIVLAGAVLHASASCVLGPCIVAMSLGLVGHAAIGERLGRNARFASIGNGLAAAAMGACGYLLSPRAVFFVTAALLVPTLLALSCIRAIDIDPERAHGGPPERTKDRTVQTIMRKRPLLILAGCAMLFHLANGSMLPLMGSVVSPWIGRRAQMWGRRPFLLLAFAALPLRGLLFATVTDPYLLVAVQALDGISAAALSIMVPLMIADLTRGTGRFNLAQGIVGTAVGIGGSISPTLAGYLTDHFGSRVAFLGLAAIAAASLSAVWALMPETQSDGK